MTELDNSISNSKKIILIVVAIALSSLVRLDMFNELTEGFGIALDVAVMGVFLYVFRELKPCVIIAICAVASPVFRMIVMLPTDESFSYAAEQAASDAGFFIFYGLAFLLLSRFIGYDDAGSFSILIFCCDIAGNIGDLLTRTAILRHNTYSSEVIGLVLFAAAVRTLIAAAVILAGEEQNRRREDAERLKGYSMLVNNATIILDEIRIMEKNMADVEDVTKRGYSLYQELDGGDYPKAVAADALELARLTHEIKGDYRNVISVLGSLYDEDLLSRKLSLLDVIRIEQAGMEAMIKHRGYDIDLIVETGEDADIDQCYKLMSVVRNLLTNAAESVAGSNSTVKGMIRLTAGFEKPGEDGTDGVCVIDVTDNGRGIPPSRAATVFEAGYSTKFNEKTGYIQRGLGLSVVKDYVENDLHGKIELLQDGTAGAHFRVTVPAAEKEQ